MDNADFIPQGLIIVHTGSGKGKTTAALGLALRAWGQGLKVLILQFIKGSRTYGELAAAKHLPGLEIRQLGEGFVGGGRSVDAVHLQAAQAALAAAREEIASGKWDMIILDEINYAVHFGLISVDDVLQLIDARPAQLHLVLTGRMARPEVIDKADLVTEMHEVKHHFQKGVKAQKGIEF